MQEFESKLIIKQNKMQGQHEMQQNLFSLYFFLWLSILFNFRQLL